MLISIFALMLSSSFYVATVERVCGPAMLFVPPVTMCPSAARVPGVSPFVSSVTLLGTLDVREAVIKQRALQISYSPCGCPSAQFTHV